MRVAVILGAGFSKNSGLPVQSEIPELLVESCYKDEFENAISLVLKRFYEEVFSYSKGSTMPGLDDILTSIDIATNSGHHLGIKYSSIRLRAVRRFLVYRLFTILKEKYSYSEDVKNLICKLIANYSKVDFIVLNWDTVLENYIKLINPVIAIDYCNGGKSWRKEIGDTTEPLKIIKIHGSSNWLYCDNCRVLINDNYDDIPLIKKAGFKTMDFELFDEFRAIRPQTKDSENCFICGDKISSHIATFSFRKSFRESSFPELWNQAEDALTGAEKWIFVGYSLPQADYEFKHLMKISELKLSHRKERKPEMAVVLLNSTTTVATYKSFFGDRISTIYNGGIEEYLKYN